ncbi:hypothetical protein [Mycobacterium noviomagense]|uniref:ATPase n=1 Tax=Mycobacterium noviomagense TaxID=459858 RepID=A0A7I7PHH2_9MYCO|nr:hypothetical protein [Mycobacterium noviomagense]ORB11315.1 hypothetical protein BST37_19925 [Mycobacterium noviomagense]BBY07970.1 hypothetical protein MNVI_32880 [Mycobacterium noviomagense]
MSTAADGFEAERFRTPVAPQPASLDAAAVTERLTAIRKGRVRRTRRTVDLTPAQHRALDIWQREAADRLGVSRVTGQEVLSVLIDQLLTNRELSAQITRAIRSRR